MTKRKKKKPRRLRVKRMQREGRLQFAQSWLQTYPGENVAVGYRKHFGVDWICAFKELEMLGVMIDPEFKKQILKSVAAQNAARRRRKLERKKANDALIEQDENFAYIVGYTDGGFPYGVPWEEWEQME
jgi:hypothetical protein